MALSSGTRLGPYEILSALGAGGMGEVYRARDTKLDRDVAIKVLPAACVFDPERVARFRREARMIAALNHPNIAAIHGVDESDGMAALVLELVEGPTLADRIAQGPVPLDEALPIAKQITEALEAAHEHGIVHRDLKPANIKVRPDGTVKVLDFGLAKALEPVGQAGPNLPESPTITAQAMTRAGVILGSAAYMSPEHARGKPVDKRTDLWAFGCVLYEMLTASPTFGGDDVSETVARVLTTEPDWSALPALTPAPIRRLLTRCLEKDRKRRLADAADAQLEIDEALNAPPATVMVPAVPVGRPCWLYLGVPAAVLAVAALAATTTWTLMRSQEGASPTSRLTIVTPPEYPLAPQGGDRDIAIARDGSFIVYRTIVAGTPQLALRRLADLDSKLLDGTADARSPFISPDGAWVGFFAETALKKVPVAGGPPIDICPNVGGVGGGVWDQTDTIVFATNDRSTGLLSVPAGGGTPTPLTKIGASLDDHLHPSVVPETDLLLLTVSLGRERLFNVAVLNRKTGEFKVLITGGRQPEYLEGGRILYAVDGMLRMVTFDTDRVAVSGESALVVERVLTFTSGAGNFAISPNGTLLYVPGTAAAWISGKELVWVDRGGNQEPVTSASGAFLDPRLSPDGARVLVEDMTDYDLWMVDLVNGRVSRQTFELGQDETARWSPDGHWIAYAAGPLGTATTRGVFRRRADGSGSEERLWDPEAHAHVDDWTPDGRALLVSTSDASGGQGDIFLLRVDSGDRKPVPLLQTRFNERGARVSPNGRWIAYYSNESGRDEVYVRSFPTLHGKWQLSVGGGSEPVWSHDGKELFYRGAALVAVRVSGTQLFSFGPPRPLFPDRLVRSLSDNHTGFDVARDGKRFLMVKAVEPVSGSAPANLVVVQNWLKELKHLLPDE
ncbi:MAG TPA: protein kinase [Vicinamibacterales bacterium]|nr:protein kinase [Vicinamibacterales bacterium]